MRPTRPKLIAIAMALACACALAVVVVVVPQHPVSGNSAESAYEAVATNVGDSSQSSHAAYPEGTPDAVTEPDDGQSAYAPGVVLATLASDATDDQANQALASVSGLEGVSVEQRVDGDIVKLSLPEGLSVERAAGLIAAMPEFEAAQPNYRYYIQETTGAESTATAAATAALAQTAADATAGLVAGTALGNALSIQSAAPNDPYYARQWSLSSVNAPEAWDLVTANTQATSAVTVAVIDNGFYVNHEDLKSHVVDAYNVEADSPTMGTDNSDHGTHVAGIVSAVTNNGKGVASVGGNVLGLMLLRVSDSKGEITTDTIVKAYSYIMNNASVHNVRVVNMSLGAATKNPVGRSADPDLYDAISNARDAGIVTVVAACNQEDGYTPPFYAFPADFDNVVSVINLAKTTANNDGVKRDSTSNYNTWNQTQWSNAKNISAPGTSIYSTYDGNYSYGLESGTSMSTPLVAGVLGLEFIVNPSLSASDAEALLYSSAKDLTASPASAGWDRYTGYGEVDAAAAMEAAGAVPLPSEASSSDPSSPSQTTQLNKKNIATCTVTVTNATYTGAPIEPAVKVTDGSTTLMRDVDYTVAYSDNTNAGMGTCTVKGMGGYGGITFATFKISGVPLQSVSLKAASATYNGKSHKPAIGAVAATIGTVSSDNYAVTYLRNNSKTTDFKSVGSITVVVTGKNNCTGTLATTFKINPKGTSISKLKSMSRGVSVTWKKRTAQTTGYQVRVATNKAFTKNVRSAKVGKTTTTSKAVKSLKAKKKYYVKVRTYKTVNGTKYYSSWSKVKSVKTKK